jgi:hypothetical protein
MAKGRKQRFSGKMLEKRVRNNKKRKAATVVKFEYEFKKFVKREEEEEDD